MRNVLITFTLLVIAACGKLNAQQPIHLDSTADFGTWSAWFADTVKGDDGTLYTWEYRYALTKRTGMAAYYEFEVKNTGTTKLSGRIHFTYTDLLIKGPASGDATFKVKPGETTSVSFIQQGCKKKDKKRSDYKSCVDCGMDYTFYITTK